MVNLIMFSLKLLGLHLFILNNLIMWFFFKKKKFNLSEGVRTDRLSERVVSNGLLFFFFEIVIGLPSFFKGPRI